MTDTFPVYLCGSGAEVWVRFKTSGGALVAGAPVMNDGATAANGLAIAAADSATLFATVVGKCQHWHDDIASESWIKVRLGGV